MKLIGEGKLLRIFVGESDRWDGRPLYEAIVHQARAMGLAGATVLRGIEGFGASSVVHTSRILRLSEDLPMVIEIVDSADRIDAFLEATEAMVEEGLVTLERVDYPEIPGTRRRHMTVLGVALGGALGALARYRLSGLVAVRQKTPFPAGTLVVNVVGSLLLGAMFGLVVAGRVSDSALVWGGVGFLGALTTFSTFTYETAILIEDGAWGYAARNAMLTIGLSFGAAALGFVALR
jgi:hypothetical protein